MLLEQNIHFGKIMLDVKQLSMGLMAASLSAISAARSPARDRFKECTHTHMTRLYERDDREQKSDGYERCSLCHRRPPLGWLYRCCQDSAGALPAPDYSNVQHYHSKPGQDARLYTLSPSLAKGVEEGYYTEEQFRLLVKQKQEVREKILGAQISISTASTQSSLSSLPASATFSTLCSSSSDTDPETFTDQLYRKALSPIKEVRDVDLDDTFPLATCLAEAEQLPAPCPFKVCHPCRPIYRDRAWGSLNTILNERVAAPPMHELANRRLSDANIVKHIGCRKVSAKHDADTYWANESSKAKKTNPAEFQSTVRRILRTSQLSSLTTNIAQDHKQETTSFEDSPANRDGDRNAAMAALMSPLYLRRGSKSPMQLDLTATAPCLYKDKTTGSPMLEIGGYPTSPPRTPRTGTQNGRSISAETATPDKKSLISRLWRAGSVGRSGGEGVSYASTTEKHSTENDNVKRDSTGGVHTVNSGTVVDRFHID